MNISEDVKFIGVNDRAITLFEGQFQVEKGMSYNSYLISDKKIAVLDTVDAAFFDEWADNLSAALGGREPDYLIVSHMEPDHSANIARFMDMYKSAVIIGNAKTFTMLKNYFGTDYPERRAIVKEGDTLSLGEHTLKFIMAPFVHWPEVMVTYDERDKILFSADGFGKFGTTDADEDWDCEARRYYFGIVGKYGAQVQALLKKTEALDIKAICPLHGPVLTDNLSHYLGLYDKWSSYTAEDSGVTIAYTSVYGHTKAAVLALAEKLRGAGVKKMAVFDLARCDLAEAVEDAFRYDRLVLATTTYNADIFPYMRRFIEALTERNYANRTVAFIENGSWAPVAGKIMRGMLENCKNLNFCNNTVKIFSALSPENEKEIAALSEELAAAGERSQNAALDPTALFKIGYGLYVVSCNDGAKDTGCIVNTVTQVTASPNRIAVTVNKQNYTHHVIKKTGKLNINCLSEDAPFSVFENFGFKSGRTENKFAGVPFTRSANGLAVLSQHINAYISLSVESYADLGTHGMFICSVTGAEKVNDNESMTYAYYHASVKPKPETQGKKGFVCRICGYIYEGESLPADFICPICKHGAEDFEPIK